MSDDDMPTMLPHFSVFFMVVFSAIFSYLGEYEIAGLLLACSGVVAVTYGIAEVKYEQL